MLRQIQDVRSEIVIVDIDAHNPARAISAIELIQANTSEIAIFAVGELSHPPTIVTAMRAGAGEFLEREATSEALIEAFTRFAASRGKGRTSSGSGAHLHRDEFQGRRGRHHHCRQAPPSPCRKPWAESCWWILLRWGIALFISMYGPRSEWWMHCKICTASMLRCSKV